MKSLIKSFLLNFRRADGLSLVEILVSIVIASILSGVVLTVFIMGAKSFKETDAISDVRTEADIMISSVLSDIATSGYDFIQVSSDGKTLSLYDATPLNVNPDSGLLVRVNDQNLVMNPNPIKVLRFGEGSLTLDRDEDELILVGDQNDSKFQIKNAKAMTINNITYYQHGILEISLKIQSTKEDKPLSLQSGIGF